MSVQALGWVFDHSPTRGAERLVLLSIANHAHQDPSNGAWEAWPGVDRIAREAGLDRRRTVTDALSRLEAAGSIERIVNGAPDERVRKDHRSNLYRIALTSGVSCGDRACGWCGVSRNDEPGVADQRDGVSRNGATGCRGATDKPSVEPSPKPSSRTAPLFGEDPPPSEPRLVDGREIATAVWEARKAQGEPVPAQKFIAVAKIADALLAAGHKRDAIVAAMLAVPTISTGWLEGELNKRHSRSRPKGAGAGAIIGRDHFGPAGVVAPEDL